MVMRRHAEVAQDARLEGEPVNHEPVNHEARVVRGSCIACLAPVPVIDGLVAPHPGVGAYADRCVGTWKRPFTIHGVGDPTKVVR